MSRLPTMGLPNPFLRVTVVARAGAVASSNNPERHRSTDLTTVQLHALDHAVLLVNRGLGTPSTYLVGSVLTDRNHRDVDVRTMLDDEEFDRLFPSVQLWGLFCYLVSRWLSAEVGLPVDYQVQKTSIANERHHGMRNPLGRERLFAGGGDATRATDG